MLRSPAAHAAATRHLVAATAVVATMTLVSGCSGQSAQGAAATPSPTPMPTVSATSTPAPTPSPVPTPTPTPTPSPTAVTGSRSALDDPHFTTANSAFRTGDDMAVGPELTAIKCGDPVSALDELPHLGGFDLTTLSVAAAGDGAGVTGRARITNNGSGGILGAGATADQPTYGANPPTFVYVQDGRIVGSGSFTMGIDPFIDADGKAWTTINPGDTFEIVAAGGGDGWRTHPTSHDLYGWTCGTYLNPADGLPSYPDTQPAGVYDVYLLAEASDWTADEGNLYLVSGKTTVTVP